jgi:hypothetical protein
MVRVYAAALAVLLLLSAPARADGPYAPTTLTASELLKRAHAAAGSDAGGIYQLVTHYHTSTQDRTRTATIDGDDSITHSVFGPFKSAYGTYHGQDWSQDENGIVTLQTDFENVEDPNVRALAHPDDPASHVTVLGVSPETPKQIVLDIDPLNGEHEMRSYDAATYLLSKIVRWEKNRLEHVTTYGDYRTAFGHTLAYRRTYSDGHSDNDSLTTIDSVEPVKAPLPDMSIPKSASLFTFASNAPIALPARLVQGHIIVRVTIKGRGLDFLLDSGSSDITINPDVAHDLGLIAYDKSTGTMGGAYDSARTIIPEMQVGTATLRNLVADETDVTDQLEGVRIVGLLGYDVIASGVFAIDFKKQSFTLYPSGAAPLDDPTLVKLPIESDDGVARVTAWFGGTPGHFLLDTGSTFTMIYQPYFGKLNATSGDDSGDWTASFVGGDVKMLPYWIDNFNFGGILYKKIGVFVPQSSTAGVGAYDGIIGRNVLQNYILIFDYADRTLYTKPNL